MASSTAPPAASPKPEQDVTLSGDSIHPDNATVWDPTFLTMRGSKENLKDFQPIYGVIVLNQPIQTHWKVEGAALVVDGNQNKTDLQKCLKSLRSLAKEWQDGVPTGYKLPQGFSEKDLNAVLVGGIGGRFDHGLAQLHHLYQETQDEYQFKGRIYMINPDSICFLLDKGLNKIYTPLGQGLFRESVGIIPIGRPSYVRTTGLEWNLTGGLTEFGGLLSTSNHIQSYWIEVETSERILFTIELDPPMADIPVNLENMNRYVEEREARRTIEDVPRSSTDSSLVQRAANLKTGP
ncbi:MAG: hypothetical protein LQ341_001294 [Variospora aurantia]|nr:MAG: hypothetical protein LQ341_001294 [Variospora aurantia]